MTRRDLDLARRICEVAADLGVDADPGVVEIVELALDTPDHAEIKPFWRAVLGYEDHPLHDREVRDLQGIGPALWFQPTDPHEEPRQRFHLDVRVPPEVAGPRIEAALAAGGTLVSDDARPDVRRAGRPAGQQGVRHDRARAGLTARATATFRDSRSTSWDDWHTGLTPDRPGDDGCRMRTDILVRTRRVS